jgi:hypothetical protein
MSKFGSTIGLAAGGTALLAATYFGVALAKGASPRAIPPVSWFAPLPHDEPADTAKAVPESSPAAESIVAMRPPVSPMTAGVLGAFVLPSPFDSRELHDVQRKIAERVTSLDAREAELERRARELDDWQRTLDLRVQEIAALRDGSGAESAPADAAGISDADPAQGEGDSWSTVAPLFQDGDPEEVAAKLAEFTPAEAASILKGLEADRAVELLNALPQDRYKPFLDAWRKAKD